MNFGKEKIVSSVISLAVIIALILSGPASAFKVSLSNFPAEAFKGEKISASAEIEIRADERVSLNDIKVIIDGKSECSFNVSGECENRGISLELVNSTANNNYGYGYSQGYGYGYGYLQGYSNGRITYNLTIDSQKYSVGMHEIKLIVNLNGRTYESDSQQVIFKPKGAGKIKIKDITSQNETLSFPEMNIDLELNLSSSQNGKIALSEFSSLPENASSFSLNNLKYFQLDSDINPNQTIIKVYYKDSDISETDESSLRLYYHNPSGSWEKYDGENGGVNTANNYVWARTSHFSLWGLFGEKITTISGNGNSGSIRRLPQEQLTIPPNPEEKKEEKVALKEDNSKKRAGITGAVIGVFENTQYLIAIIFLIALVSLALIVLVIRRRRARLGRGY